MPVLKRLLHKSAKGPVMNDEDWWYLLFDTDAKALCVEHEWEHVDVRGGGDSDSGKERMEIGTFLHHPSQGPAQRELERLIAGLFDGKADA